MQDILMGQLLIGIRVDVLHSFCSDDLGMGGIGGYNVGAAFFDEFDSIAGLSYTIISIADIQRVNGTVLGVFFIIINDIITVAVFNFA
jgi:hypothetical protein